MPQSRRQFLFRLVAVVGGTTLGMLIVDVACRLILGKRLSASVYDHLKSDPPLLLTARSPSDTDFQQAHVALMKGRWPHGCLRYNPHIAFYENTPNVSGSVIDITTGQHEFYHHINGQGFRVPVSEREAVYATGGHLFGGCSFTYGDGVDAEATCAHGLSQRTGVPSYNFGVCGYSYATIIKQFDFLNDSGMLAELKPSTYILGAGGWLHDRSLSPFYPTSIFQLQFPHFDRDADGSITIQLPPRENQFVTIADFLRAYFAEEGETLTARRRALLQELSPHVRRVDELKRSFRPADISATELITYVISEIKQRCEQRELRLVVLGIPSYFNPDRSSEKFRAIAEASRELNVPFADGSLIWERGANKEHAFPHRYHPSAATHRALADVLQEVLES